MQNSLFSSALTPIPGRTRTHHAVESVRRVASHYPRSSTPLRDAGAASCTQTQEPIVQKKSSRTDCNAGQPDRKRKSSVAGTEKVAKRKVTTATAGRNDRSVSKAVSGRSRIIDSLAGQLQQQAHEVTFDICCSLHCYMC